MADDRNVRNLVGLDVVTAGIPTTSASADEAWPMDRSLSVDSIIAWAR